jgi:hypothetical protein
MGSYGIIVEGESDQGVYEEFIQKICNEEVWIKARATGGRAQLMKTFPVLLRSMEHITEYGGPVDKALVIRDADCKDALALEAKMKDSLDRRNFPFPRGVGLHAVKQEMETWLLADHEAISRVAAARGGKAVPRIPDPLEDIQDAKEKFVDVLSRADLNYTAQVCREIAKETDISKLRVRCPSFTAFEQKVLDP